MISIVMMAQGPVYWEKLFLLLKRLVIDVHYLVQLS